ncbi:serine hydrolase [Microlunatus speluncae]|uniref:serine hydrolase n=1 Tax=Microlunatus speluncae TaxID=2594267 RepID=UPI00137580A2|nr:serine hydrolase [Microlunatus speluncae]
MKTSAAAVATELERLVAERPDPGPATVSVTLLDDHGDTVAEVNPDAQHYAASTMKLPLVLAAYRLAAAGKLDLDAELPVHNEFTSQVGTPFGVVQEDDSDPQPWDRLGGTATLRWLCQRSVVRSSNLATNLVLDQVGLPAVAEAIATCGATGVSVGRGINDYAARDRLGDRNLITTRGLATILSALHHGTAADRTTCDAVLAVLAANEVATDLRAGLPPGTWVAHKNGWVTDVVHDAGLIRPPDARPFVLAVATTAPWPGEVAHAFIASIAAAVWERRHAL